MLSEDTQTPLPMSSAAPQSMTWGIADLAREYGVTARTLRFYEDKGLLTPSREGSVRVFNERDCERLTEILRAKRMGFSLDDIKEVFDVMDGQVLDRAELLKRKSSFERVIASLERRQSDIKIVQTSLGTLCENIVKFVNDPSRDINNLQFADAYEAALRGAMDDDF